MRRRVCSALDSRFAATLESRCTSAFSRLLAPRLAFGDGQTHPTLQAADSRVPRVGPRALERPMT